MALKAILTALAVAWGAGAGAALAADPASAPPTPGGKAVLARQAHYKELNAASGGLNAELRKEAPDKALIAGNAGKMKVMADDLPGWFPKGSGPEAGVKTQAKAEIWTDAAGFAAAVTRLQAETARLQEAAGGGDLDAIRAQARATAGACKACHDRYRAQDQH
jgi:cytochrome c556